jgi:hypothetical protein
MTITDTKSGKVHILQPGFTMYHLDEKRCMELVKLGILEIISQPTDVTTDPPPLKMVKKSQVPSYPFQQSFALN